MRRRRCPAGFFDTTKLLLLLRWTAGLWAWSCLVLSTSLGADYFLTIGGGYVPSQNQASLEANVTFLQSILKQRQLDDRPHAIYFADGFDDEDDLQYAVEQPDASSPLIDLLARLHRQPSSSVEYRNHQVPGIAGANLPDLVRSNFEALAQQLRSGDRLLIYVTAHGGRGDDDDPHNTLIACWDDQHITMRDFAGWLDQLPSDVPVIMVMAQCFAGGFAHTIFDDGDDAQPLARQLRVGFFAQRYDLPAAGCRPDIKDDQEFSSYFWGALAGHRRTGEPTVGCDLDHNGQVSFLEAYVHAVTESETIDIPLRASDELLRVHSRLRDDSERDSDSANQDSDNDDDEDADDEGDGGVDSDRDRDRDRDAADANLELAALEGTLGQLIDSQSTSVVTIVTRLSESLGFTLDTDVDQVRAAYDQHRSSSRRRGRGFGRRGRSGRRELLAEISRDWPELADRDTWTESPLLAQDTRDEIYDQIRQLESFERYDQRWRRTVEQEDTAQHNELREVKFRRLLHTLRSIVLARNLPRVAPAEVVQRYEQMIQLEDATLGVGTGSEPQQN